MAIVTLLASGDALELLPAASTRGFIQNTGASHIEVENAADPADGLLIGPGETLNVGFASAWTAAWTGRSPNGVDVVVRVAFE
jgi:hypothetical protein